MTIIGFAFTKIGAHQKKTPKGNLKINNNIKIENVEKTNLTFDAKRLALKALFSYTVTYEPDVGELNFEGDILFLEEKKQAENLVAAWQEKKALPEKLTELLVANIMQKCNIQALIMTRDVGLPPPIPLPKVRPKTSKAAQKTTPKK